MAKNNAIRNEYDSPKVREKEDAYKSLEIINGWISNIDSKTSFLLAYISVLMGFVISGVLPVAVSFTTRLDVLMVFRIIIICLTYLCCFCCIILLFLALKARVKNKNQKPSLLFFGTISTYSLEDYLKKTNARTDDEIVKDIREQIHTNAVICAKKTEMYNGALFCAIASTTLSFIGFLLGSI